MAWVAGAGSLIRTTWGEGIVRSPFACQYPHESRYIKSIVLSNGFPFPLEPVLVCFTTRCYMEVYVLEMYESGHCQQV